MAIKIGFITVSDRASQGEYKDLSGPAMNDWVQNAVLSEFETEAIIVPDEQDLIEKAMLDMVKENCNVILTSGGTGPTIRDVTPEATKNVCTRIYDGFAEEMRRYSLKTVPTAILSRQMAGTRDNSLIINLPGKPVAIGVCLSAIFLAVPKCLELLNDTTMVIDIEFIEIEQAKAEPNEI